MGRESRRARSYLIPQTLASNDGDLIANTLVGFEVQGQLWVITFDYDFGGFLDGLCANATLCFKKWSAPVSSQNIGIGFQDNSTIFVVKFDVKFESLRVEIVGFLAWKKFVGSYTADYKLDGADLCLGTGQ